jgi:WD repeat-containing protein 19
VLAPHCLAAGDDRGAVEFLLLAGQLDQAFDIAAARGQMEAFAELVGAGTSGAGEARRIAEYYLKRGELEQAADMWSKAGEPGKAVTLFVQVRAEGFQLPFQRDALMDLRQVLSIPCMSINHP